MKVKNTSGKIINIGMKAILPGDTAEIGNSYANNDVIQMLRDTGELTVKETATKSGRKAAKTEPESDKDKAESDEVK